jgi:hypothetical protein
MHIPHMASGAGWTIVDDGSFSFFIAGADIGRCFATLYDKLIVLREHEAKDHETDEAPAEDTTPPRGRNGDGERNAPRSSQRR